jgi:hypothetical protein
MEIFAYQFGCLIDVSVPPAFVAKNSKTGESGALIEWFYEPYEWAVDEKSNDESNLKKTLKEKYVPGGDIFRSRIENFDQKRKDNIIF